jgi:hypothetical protein
VRSTVFPMRKQLRRGVQTFWMFAVTGVVLLAAEPSWTGKPISSWTQEDVRQILTDSPWARTVKAGITRLQGEDERREGGKMGQDHGVGFDGIPNTRAKLPKNLVELLFRGPNGPVRTSQFITVRLRWESALPVRFAELRSDGMEPLTLPGDGYSIAVYGVPGSGFKGDPKKLGEPLKKDAVLRREGKKDVRPSDVEVFQREEGVVVVYVFPASAEIGKKDGSVEFDAQIGRIIVAQSFDVSTMEFQGKLEF